MGEDAPAPQDIKHAIGKFASDAKRWSDTGDTLSEAKKSAENLNVSAKTFGLVTAVGIHNRYNDVQQMIVDRLREGDEELHAIGKALITARDAYQKDEDEGVHKSKQNW